MRAPRSSEAPASALAALAISGTPGKNARMWPPSRASSARIASAGARVGAYSMATGELPSRDAHDRRPTEKGCHRFRIERRGHHDDVEVVAGEPRLPCQGEREVGVETPLVELVDDHRTKSGKQRIGLQARGQDPFGRHQHAGRRGEFPVEANVPARLLAQRPPTLRGDSPGEGACREPPWLQHDDGAVIRQRGWYARRFSRARGRDDDGGAVFPDEPSDGVEVFVDGERVEHHPRRYAIGSI